MKPLLYFDIETGPRLAAWDLVKPDARLTDPKKIEASIAEKRADLPTDPLGAEPLILVYQLGDGPLTARWFTTEEMAEDALDTFWKLYSTAPWPVLCGYFIKRFDLPALMHDSRMRGIRVPEIDLNKYHHDRVIDLIDEVTFYGACEKGEISRSQDTICKLFGIDLPDPLPNGGADVPGLWAKGDAESLALIQRHCENDVRRTVALAHALGVVDDF